MPKNIGDTQTKSKLTVVILTKDEASCIERCVESVLWADEVLVLDSGSTDETCSLARKMGAVVRHQDWLGYAKQRNKGAELASNDWIFFVDADEIVTKPLRESVQSAMEMEKSTKDGFSLSRRGDFMGVLLPNSSPPWRQKNFIRLINRLENKFDESMQVHESVCLSGQPFRLKGELLHWNGHSMQKYISDINRYSDAEADALYSKGVRVSAAWILVRFVLRFIWCYFVCREFRLGARGFLHSFMAAVAEYIRYSKLWEKCNVEDTPDPPISLWNKVNGVG